MCEIGTLRKLIEQAERIVLLSGAGVSRASGIPDFRSPDGLYQRDTGISVSPETALSYSFFVSNPADFYRYYRTHLCYPNARPNTVHRFFAELEAAGKLSAILTQNVDGLHSAAGNQTVLELHGSAARYYCMECGTPAPAGEVINGSNVPLCPRCGGLIRPDIVLYEEPLDMALLTAAMQQVAACDLLICAGTSLCVQPAAGLVSYRQPHTPLVILNRQPTPYDQVADLVIAEDLCRVVAALTDSNP